MGDPPSLIPRGGPPGACPNTLSLQRHGTLHRIIGIHPGWVKKRSGRRAKPMTQGSGGGPDAHFRDRLENLQEYCSAVW